CIALAPIGPSNFWCAGRQASDIDPPGAIFLGIGGGGPFLRDPPPVDRPPAGATLTTSGGRRHLTCHQRAVAARLRTYTAELPYLRYACAGLRGARAVRCTRRGGS